MSRILTTFSGKYGDILWALPTVREISRLVGAPVDFVCMPQYESLLALIGGQEYVDAAYVLPKWIMLHSNYGDQPWNPPGHLGCLTNVDHKCASIEHPYDFCYHLGYRKHPGVTMGGEEMQLIDFIANQQGIKLPGNPLPFLAPPREWVYPHDGLDVKRHPYIAYAFNEQYKELKDRFMMALVNKFPPDWMVSVSQLRWAEALLVISRAAGYLGCRSACHVMAHGVGQRMFTYEPHPARHRDGHLGFVFGCNYGKELTAVLNATPELAAQEALPVLTSWIKEKTKEHEHETTTPESRGSGGQTDDSASKVQVR